MVTTRSLRDVQQSHISGSPQILCFGRHPCSPSLVEWLARSSSQRMFVGILRDMLKTELECMVEIVIETLLKLIVVLHVRRIQ